MAQPSLVLFDDKRAREWEPFALTRPAGELLFGDRRLVERVETVLRRPCIGYLAAPHLAGFSEPGARPVIGFAGLPSDRDLIFWCSRAASDLSQAIDLPDAPAVLTIDGQPVGLLARKGQLPDPAALEDLTEARLSGPEIPVGGKLLEWPWDLILGTLEQLGRDLDGAGPAASSLPEGAHHVGESLLVVGRDVRVEPGSLLDTREGPIVLADGVEVRAFTRLVGPAYIGPGSRLLGGSFERISTGPVSYLRGEVAESVILGYTNKAHDGHLGHAYLGRWVNLGAFTTNSDLKNNYGPVKMWTPGGVRNTGALKLGSLIGDHVKTGIGLLLGTGTVLGAGANVYGTAMPPRYVPPFSWGEGSELVEYRLADFLATTEKAMGRRGVELDERGRRYLESCWRKGRGG